MGLLSTCSVERFNPLPSQKQGETLCSSAVSWQQKVSIRSPHKSKGRPEPDVRSDLFEQFQSAPLTKARGDSVGSRYELV